ncbi:hypothetical protein [Intrasporangium sp.]|uniref:hypothetical protein n=1 Tax=Intrasporangium sp. TaxID=1925024 RepID=UPI003221C37D
MNRTAAGPELIYRQPAEAPEKETDMCRAVTCRTCGKTTWAGCGQHVDQVMRNVPSGQRCRGHEKQAAAPAGGMLARLFGRG